VTVRVQNATTGSVTLTAVDITAVCEKIG
jgi:hypothetical protein